MACGANQEADDLMDQLTEDVNFTLPDIDLTLPEFTFPSDRFSDMYNPIKQLTLADVTEKKFDGEGAFDVMMAGISAHLEKEFQNNRISGAEYTKAFIALVQTGMGSGIQYLLQKDINYWQAQTAQLAAFTARVDFETAKMRMAQQQFDALTSKANYALTKMKLAESSMTYCVQKYQLEQLMPMQLQQLTAQKDLTKEQIEVQRAQTMNVRTDGTAIVGTLGKQRDLYDQQITSYKRDAEVKAAKLFTDAWITMKTIDDGLTVPNGFTNSSIDMALTKLKQENGFT